MESRTDSVMQQVQAYVQQAYSVMEGLACGTDIRSLDPVLQKNILLQTIDKGNALAGDVLQSLSTAVIEMEHVNAMIQNSAENAVLQLQSVNQIKDGAEELSQGVQDNSATSEELAAQSVVLNDLMRKFKLN